MKVPRLKFYCPHCQHYPTEILSFLDLKRRHTLAVEEVTVDMWGGFPKVIKEIFPNAVITYDRFHAMKLINDELNKLINSL